MGESHSTTNGANGAISLDPRLQDRLNNPDTVAALSKLLDRAESLATAVETAENLLQQGPGFIGMVTDISDESIRATGTDLEVVLRHSLSMAQNLENERLVHVINRLLAQPEQLETALDCLEQAPGMTATMLDVVDESMRQAQAAGLDPDLLLQNSLQIASRLQNPKLVKAMTRLLDQSDALETLADLAEQGPGMVAMVGDVLDESAKQAAEQGLNLDALLPQLLELTIKAQNPAILSSLNRILDSPKSLEMMAGMVEQAPGLVAMLGDVLDDSAKQAADMGLDLDGIIPQVLELMVKAQNPDLLKILNRVLDQTETLELAISLMENGPSYAALVADSLDEFYKRTVAAGLDIDRVLPKVLEASTRLISLLESDEFDALLDSGMLEPQTVDVVGRTGKALTQSYHQNQQYPQRLGPIGILRALNDPQIQQTLGFLMNFARNFGQELQQKS